MSQQASERGTIHSFTHSFIQSSIQKTWIKEFQKASHWDIPGGSMDKNLPANSGDTVSIPGPGRFHMPRSNWTEAPQLLSPRAATAEAGVPKACAP